jgi:hypothetical protein
MALQVSPYLGASALVCQASNGNDRFATCPAAAINEVQSGGSLLISNGATVGNDCQFLGLLALPAC